MTILQERRHGMHRHSDEDVAAVVLAAVTELRSRRYGDRARIRPAGPDIERVRAIRMGRLPRDQYEAQAGPDDPLYSDLPADRLDEDQLEWFVVQALTGS